MGRRAGRMSRAAISLFAAVLVCWVLRGDSFRVGISSVRVSRGLCRIHHSNKVFSAPPRSFSLSSSRQKDSALFSTGRRSYQTRGLWTQATDRFLTLVNQIWLWLRSLFQSSHEEALKKKRSIIELRVPANFTVFDSVPPQPPMPVPLSPITEESQLAHARKYAEERLRILAEARTKTDQPPRNGTVPCESPALVTLYDLPDLAGKRVLLRCDLDLLVADATAADDVRWETAWATIQHLRSRGAKVMLLSHRGTPSGSGYERSYSLAPLAPLLSRVLNASVAFVPDCVGISVAAAVHALRDGDVALLENVGFYAEETQNDDAFAGQLAAHADIFVMDSFSAAHQAQASTVGVARLFNASAAGLLVQSELEHLQSVVGERPLRPIAAIVSGTNVSRSGPMLEALLDKVDTLVVSGAMAFTFLKARGLEVGHSLVDDDQLAAARRLQELAQAREVRLVLAEDAVVSPMALAAGEDVLTQAQLVDVANIPADAVAVDIGPRTIALISDALAPCNTIVWSGAMGDAVVPVFVNGTVAVAEMLAQATDRGKITVVGGGAVATVRLAGLASRMSHISTGVDSSLEFLEGKGLPGVAALHACRGV